MSPKAVPFDSDSTLVDSNEVHVTAWQEAFAHVVFGFDRQVNHDRIGKGTDMLVPALLPAACARRQKTPGDARGYDDVVALLRGHASSPSARPQA